MKPSQLRPNPEFLEQLALNLDLDEPDRSQSGFVTPDEARRRSQAARHALELQGKVSGEAPEWFGQYQQLLNAGWPWRVACYIAWAASPKINRWPANQEDLARLVLGLTSDRQIGTWRKKNAAIDDVIATLQAAPLLEHRADAMLALAQSASNPDHRSNPDRKLFFEMTGDYVPHAKVDVEHSGHTDVSEMSDADLAKLAGRILIESGEENDGQDC